MDIHEVKAYLEAQIAEKDRDMGFIGELGLSLNASNVGGPDAMEADAFVEGYKLAVETSYLLILYKTLFPYEDTVLDPENIADIVRKAGEGLKKILQDFDFE